MAKYKIVKVKKGKKSVRKITSKDQMYDNLIAMQYDPRIVEELFGIWAEHVNGAYKKGFTEGLAGENGGYVPRSDCKPLSVYDHDEIYVGNGKGTSTPYMAPLPLTCFLKQKKKSVFCQAQILVFHYFNLSKTFIILLK